MKNKIIPDYIPEDKIHLYPQIGKKGKFRDYVPAEEIAPVQQPALTIADIKVDIPADKIPEEKLPEFKCHFCGKIFGKKQALVMHNFTCKKEAPKKLNE